MNTRTASDSGRAISGSTGPGGQALRRAALSRPSTYASFPFYFYSYPRSFAGRPGEASE
jgi:hypothetical protein